MQQKRLSIDERTVPAPFDRAMAARGREAWTAAVAECPAELRDAAELGARDTESLIDGVLSTSPFLSTLLTRRAPTALATLGEGPSQPLARVMADLSGTELDQTVLMRRLRIAKQDVALIVALADLAGSWTLEQVTAALSDLADAAIRLCIDHLIAKYAQRGAWAMPTSTPAYAEFGLVCLAMGKLGARELNYSSDIDLILFFDGDHIESDDDSSLSNVFSRLSRDFHKLLETRTGDGYVFRTDLRLRPDPGATPPVISLSAAEGYYHSVGQTWERAAMIKARPLTGSAGAIAATRAIIEPFVWRRHLDFWAIEDVHAVKQQIHAHRGGGRIAVGGHNVKLGRGGIREIEFFAQTQQLIWGGREPLLRAPVTVDALAALVAAGHVAKPAAEELMAAYRYLRRVEHRLQMVEDQQTHILPDNDEELRRISCLMGQPDLAVFRSDLTGHLRAVHGHYAELFEDTALPSIGSNLVFTGADDDPGTIETLTGFGFSDPGHATELVRGWFAGRYRSTRSDRAQQLMNRLIPELLQAVGRTADPDSALIRFDRFLQGLPSGVQLFSLFAANSHLLEVVAEMMGSAPRLAEYLAQHAGVLDAMLAPGFYGGLPDLPALRAMFEARLSATVDFETLLDDARALTNEVKFQANLQLLRGAQPVEPVSDALSDLAEAAIGALLPRVRASFFERYGDVEDGAFAVLALGRLGSRDMTARSDLDLVFVYDAPPDVQHSSGARQIAVSQYFAQLGQRLIAALSAPTASGRLYDVDMRLRPSGNAGPIAVSLASFADYHGRSAWTWEHMALTRARVVAAPDRLGAALSRAVTDALTRPRDMDQLAIDVDDMRARLRKQFGSDEPWDIKHRDGGLVDIEFITQFLQLRHAAEYPDCLAPSIGEALSQLVHIGALTIQQVDTLRAAHHMWHSIQAILRLTVEGAFDPAVASADQKAALARATGAVDFTALVEQMADFGQRVRSYYADLIAAPAAAARAKPTTLNQISQQTERGE